MNRRDVLSLESYLTDLFYESYLQCYYLSFVIYFTRHGEIPKNTH